MATKDGYQNRIELLQGTLDMLILKTLQWGEQHGYGISQAIRVSSGDVLQVNRLSISRFAQVGTSTLGQGGMEAERKQPAREVLQDHKTGQGTTCFRLRTLGKDGRDD